MTLFLVETHFNGYGTRVFAVVAKNEAGIIPEIKKLPDYKWIDCYTVVKSFKVFKSEPAGAILAADYIE